MIGDVHTTSITSASSDNCRDETDNTSNFNTLSSHSDVAIAKQIPATHGNHKRRTQQPCARHGVQEFVDCEGLEGNCKEIHHLIAHCVGIEVHARGVLHPAVGNQDPPSRECGSKTSEPSGGEVEAFADFAPTEEHQRDESGLHEEREDAFDGERCSKDVTHKPRVVAPVRTKFKFKDDTRGNTNGEVDAEEFLPKLGGSFPKLITSAVINSFHNRHHECKSEGEGNKQPVIACREGKLGARPVEDCRVRGL